MDIVVDDLRLRTLTSGDAGLLVEATRDETGRALWGARPAGPYSLGDARAALEAWDPGAGGQVSFGMLRGDRLVAALGLMPDGALMPEGALTAELAYWVRRDERRQGIGLRGVLAVTRWAHDSAGLRRVWLEIHPGNAASLRLAERAGFRFEERAASHCRSWITDDPAQDDWHDCLILASELA